VPRTLADIDFEQLMAHMKRSPDACASIHKPYAMCSDACPTCHTLEPILPVMIWSTGLDGWITCVYECPAGHTWKSRYERTFAAAHARETERLYPESYRAKWKW